MSNPINLGINNQHIATGRHLLGVEILGRKMSGYVQAVELFGGYLYVISSTGYMARCTSVSYYLSDTEVGTYAEYMRKHYAPTLQEYWEKH